MVLDQQANVPRAVLLAQAPAGGETVSDKVAATPALDLNSPPVRSIEWIGGIDGYARIIDQTLLPTETRYLDIQTPEQMWEAIRSLRIRGAPAIGIAAAMGVVLGLRGGNYTTGAEVVARACEVADYLATSRPTAVNLFWALDRMRRVAKETRQESPDVVRRRLLSEAEAIRAEDAALCRRIAEHGAPLMPDEGGVLTHCNTGGLATAELGTALGVIVAAVARGKRLRVFVDETRPLLQGARLTTWELQQWGIPHELICDSAAAYLMRSEQVNAVIVGADRIAANGDVANKIGTYMLAISAARHAVPFYVAAPHSTFDLSLASGDKIPIEQRSAEEVCTIRGVRVAPAGTSARNLAFDVTPAELITAIITDRGVISPVTAESVRAVLGDS